MFVVVGVAEQNDAGRVAVVVVVGDVEVRRMVVMREVLLLLLQILCGEVAGIDDSVVTELGEGEVVEPDVVWLVVGELVVVSGGPTIGLPDNVVVVDDGGVGGGAVDTLLDEAGAGDEKEDPGGGGPVDTLLGVGGDDGGGVLETVEELMGVALDDKLAELLELVMVLNCCCVLEDTMGTDELTPPDPELGLKLELGLTVEPGEVDPGVVEDTEGGLLLCGMPFVVEYGICRVVELVEGVTLEVGLPDEVLGEVVGEKLMLLRVVVIVVETGGGGPTVVEDTMPLELDGVLIPVSSKTMGGAYGTFTTMADWPEASAPLLTLSMSYFR